MLQRLEEKRRELALEMAALERAQQAVMQGDEEDLLGSSMLAMALQQGKKVTGGTRVGPSSRARAAMRGRVAAVPEDERMSSEEEQEESMEMMGDEADDVADGVERLLRLAGGRGSRAFKRARVGAVGTASVGYSSVAQQANLQGAAEAGDEGGRGMGRRAAAVSSGSRGGGHMAGFEPDDPSGPTVSSSSAPAQEKSKVQELKEVCDR